MPLLYLRVVYEDNEIFKTKKSKNSKTEFLSSLFLFMVAGHGKCYCGNCYCSAGWHGDKCEFQCDISPWESKRRCTSPDGKICSNRGLSLCKHLPYSDITNISHHPLTNNKLIKFILNATAGASKSN